jgi:hypothetical protein
MPAALTPRVRIMVICDGARESKIEAGVYNLKGVRQGITAAVYPVSCRLRVFLLLSSARAGKYPGYVKVVNESDDKTVHYAQLSPTPEFSEDLELLSGVSRIRCSFPEPGRYTVQLWFFQKHGNDVLKGELTFSLTKEGD